MTFCFFFVRILFLFRQDFVSEGNIGIENDMSRARQHIRTYGVDYRNDVSQNDVLWHVPTDSLYTGWEIAPGASLIYCIRPN